MSNATNPNHDLRDGRSAAPRLLITFASSRGASVSEAKENAMSSKTITVLKAVSRATPNGRFWVYLSSCGNPDHGQYAPLSEPEVKFAATLVEVRDLAMRYIEDNDLGGGNWNGGIFGEGRVILGHVSYNGRLWEGLDTSKEITIEVRA